MTAGCSTELSASQTGDICVEAVDYVKFSLFHSNYWLKDKRTAWRFRIKLLCCVTQNIEHIYRAPASDYILLEFCSFPTEHMIIITVLLHCYLEFMIVS